MCLSWAHRVQAWVGWNHLVLCYTLLLLPSIFAASGSFQMKRWHQVAKYWSFSFSIIPSKGIPGLISFRMDWLDLLAVQGTLKSLFQHHSSKASILWLERHPQLSLATRGEDWASQGQPKGKAEIPVVTRESRRNSRKTTWVPPLGKMSDSWVRKIP